eukprot:7371404-Prymnesium_polylepis.1
MRRVRARSDVVSGECEEFLRNIRGLQEKSRRELQKKYPSLPEEKSTPEPRHVWSIASAAALAGRWRLRPWRTSSRRTCNGTGQQPRTSARSLRPSSRRSAARAPRVAARG